MKITDFPRLAVLAGVFCIGIIAQAQPAAPSQPPLKPAAKASKTVLRASQVPLEQREGLIVLRRGDSLEIRLGGVPIEEINQVTGTYTVDTQGYVNMPHIGRVKADGLTQDQLQTAIQNIYLQKEIYTNPTITVTVPMQYRFVNVGGEVKMPQRVAYTPDLTVLSAISAAGGFTEFASQSRVRLMRGGKVVNVDIRKVRKDPSKDISLEPGDSIEVMRSFF